MFTALVILLVLVSVALIILIMSQASKGGGLSGLVGGAATDMMGSHGASDFIKKMTRILGAAFMLIALLSGMLVINQNKKGGAVKSGGYSNSLQKEMAKKTAPASPAAPAQSSPGTIPLTPTSAPASK
jgi:preprotein translocase subunit SecG